MTDINTMRQSIAEIKAFLPEGVTLVAATKTVPPEIINAAIDEGITEIGENRAEELCEKYPQYQFSKHKGYGTKLHYEMLTEHGISEHHRMSFLGSFLGTK